MGKREKSTSEVSVTLHDDGVQIVNGLSDSSVGVFVGPPERESRFIVMADVAHDFAMKIGLGCEDATCNEVSLNFGEPDLDLVEPRGVGRGVVELDVAVGAQEALDRLWFYESKGCRR